MIDEIQKNLLRQSVASLAKSDDAYPKLLHAVFLLCCALFLF